jgi:hypothetical protein
MMSVTIRSGWTKRARRIALCGALGLLVLTAFTPGGAQAQDEEDNKTTIWNFEKKILDGMMRGLGFRNGNESSIEYRERSPLVIPPNRNLPPPEQAGAGQNAAWPADPDVKRKQDAAAKKKAQNYRGYDPDREGRNLNPSELNPTGSTRSAGTSKRTGSPTDMGDDGQPRRPSELGYFGNLFSSIGSGSKEEVTTFDREPERDRLTAPPAGYQTPSAAQPYGIDKNKDRRTVAPVDRAVGY